MDVPPLDCPYTVTRDGSPPNAAMLAWTHLRASCWSKMPDQCVRVCGVQCVCAGGWWGSVSAQHCMQEEGRGQKTSTSQPAKLFRSREERHCMRLAHACIRMHRMRVLCIGVGEVEHVRAVCERFHA